MAATAASDVTERMSDQLWRLNNLYKIRTKEGRLVDFHLNPDQLDFYERLWYRNLILKVRQLGFSTLIEVLLLDTCMYNDGIQAGVIAHDREAAEDLFFRNVQTPYDNLPEELKQARPETSRNARTLRFPNGSSIRVGTSMRSGTIQMLHVSEMGKIAARYPHKAREIVTGSFEAVPSNGFLCVESTAEGREGWFYEAVKAARDMRDQDKPLTKLDFRLHFYDWMHVPEYRLTQEESRGVVIHPYRRDYFDALEKDLDITIDNGQRAWWVKKAATLGDDIYREYPATIDEAFYAALHGTYYAQQLRDARLEGRIGSVPHEFGYAVETWWDFGLDDQTVIWFVQQIGRELHVIDHYKASGETLAHYVRVLNEKAAERGFIYGDHYVPHDATRRNDATVEDVPMSRLQILKTLGMRNITVVNKTPDVGHDIETVRQELPRCYFDEEACAEGISALESYRKEWDEHAGTYKSRPHHGPESDDADAFRTGIKGRAVAAGSRVRAQKKQAPTPRAWT